MFKDWNGIDHNSFLKVPVLVNSIFLRKLEWIESMGQIFVISPLHWRLIGLNMRSHLDMQSSRIAGWDNKPTLRPGNFMMTTMFDSIRIIRVRNQKTINGSLSRGQE